MDHTIAAVDTVEAVQALHVEIIQAYWITLGWSVVASMAMVPAFYIVSIFIRDIEDSYARAITCSLTIMAMAYVIVQFTGVH